MRAEFFLEPDVAYLNHGAFGAAPRKVPVMAFGGRLWARISAQIYNHIGDYRRLADALTA